MLQSAVAQEAHGCRGCTTDEDRAGEVTQPLKRRKTDPAEDAQAGAPAASAAQVLAEQGEHPAGAAQPAQTGQNRPDEQRAEGGAAAIDERATDEPGGEIACKVSRSRSSSQTRHAG